MFIGLCPGQRYVAPLAASVVWASHQPVVNHNATTAAGAKNDSKYGAHVCPRAVMGFRKGEAVSIIGQPYRALHAPFKIEVEWAAIEPNRISVLNHPRRRRDRARNANANTI